MTIRSFRNWWSFPYSHYLYILFKGDTIGRNKKPVTLWGLIGISSCFPLTFQGFHCYRDPRVFPSGAFFFLQIFGPRGPAYFRASLEWLGALITWFKGQDADSFCLNNLTKGPSTQHISENKSLLGEFPVWVIRQIAALLQEAAVGVDLNTKMFS